MARSRPLNGNRAGASSADIAPDGSVLIDTTQYNNRQRSLVFGNSTDDTPAIQSRDNRDLYNAVQGAIGANADTTSVLEETDTSGHPDDKEDVEKRASCVIRVGTKGSLTIGERTSDTDEKTVMKVGYQVMLEQLGPQEYNYQRNGQSPYYTYGMLIREHNFSPFSNAIASDNPAHPKHQHVGTRTNLTPVATRQWVLESNEVLKPFHTFSTEGCLSSFSQEMLPDFANGNAHPTNSAGELVNQTIFRNPITVHAKKHYVIPNPAILKTTEDRFQFKLATGGSHNYGAGNVTLLEEDNEFTVECPSEFKADVKLNNADVVDENGDVKYATFNSADFIQFGNHDYRNNTLLQIIQSLDSRLNSLEAG